jgi:hypothetical protein
MNDMTGFTRGAMLSEISDLFREVYGCRPNAEYRAMLLDSSEAELKDTYTLLLGML